MKARAAELSFPPPTASTGAVASAALPLRGYRSAAADLDEAETVRRYVPTVKRLAAHLKGRLPESVPLEDLMQAGLIAVLRIARHGGTASLSEPALRRAILNAMIDEARRETWAPVRIVRLAKAAAEAMRAIRRRTGEDGSDEEVAAEMGIPLAEYRRVLLEIAGIRLLPIDACEDDGEARLQSADSQETSLYRRRVMAALSAAIAALPERERLVVSLYYEHELNMEEIGRVLGLNKSTVCRAHGRALLRLRSALGGDEAERAAPPSSAGE
ncbi:MAG TPA: sigma-70 family RNA polymerase sigma factor [Stellaceae bacterium]|nr:sigma-70 family RNA polymerase sigma factor [Stellaceae bacterium]